MKIETRCYNQHQVSFHFQNPSASYRMMNEANLNIFRAWAFKIYESVLIQIHREYFKDKQSAMEYGIS